MQQIVIVGAGLTGLACALHLVRRGFQVSLFEYRSAKEIHSEHFIASYSSGRAMSMDLSARGMFTLENLGLLDQVKRDAVPMKSKIFHLENGRLMPFFLSPSGEEVFAVSRNHLFQTLLKQAAQFDKITIHFRKKLVGVNFDTLALEFEDLDQGKIELVKPDILIGADGTNSKVRQSFENYTGSYFKITSMPQSYKELSIPAEQGKHLEHHAMHFWSRDKMMLVAQPNFDHSFTCALLMPEEGLPNSFKSIEGADGLRQLFETYFPDAYPLIPRLEEQYAKTKPNCLKIIQGSTWTCNGNAVLLGDAAHGTVPFFGQGVNCCFEDCTVLEQSLSEANNHWPTALALVEQRRVANSNAMSSMSFTNYPELLQANVINRVLLKKQIEQEVSRKYRSEYITYHNLVCFSRVPYLYAMACKSLQESILDRLADGIERVDQLDWEKVDNEISSYKKKIYSMR